MISIIKYEFLDIAIKELNKKLTHKIQEKSHLNKSTRKNNNYKQYYDTEMIQLVNNKCARELKYFNYDFNGSTKFEPFIINCNLKYDVKNDKIIK